MTPFTSASGLLDGEVAVITGASSGNGRAIALAFARAGARAVIVADIEEEPREGGLRTVDMLRSIGSRAEFVAVDVRVPGQIMSAVDAAERFGGVTIMVNNAGVLSSAPFLEVSIEAYDRVAEINLRGTFFGAQAAARSMVRHGHRGSIINMSSIAGLRGTAELSAYSATKGAVGALSFALASELGVHGIRVNALHPGIIRTAMTTTDLDMLSDSERRRIPLGRFGEPDDVANACVYLACGLSSYVSGTSLVVDGGMTYAETVT